MTDEKLPELVVEMDEELTMCAFHCGQPAHNGRRLCEEHLEDQRQKMAHYRAERKRMMLCSRCPNPARKLPDGTASTLCEVCRAHVRALEAQQAAARVVYKDSDGPPVCH